MLAPSPIRPGGQSSTSSGAVPIERGRAKGAALATDRHGDPAGIVADIAASNGFAVTVDPRPRGTVVALGGCPFASIAGPVVCALHRGIVEGTARTADGAVAHFDLAGPINRPCEVTFARCTGDTS